MGQSKESCLNRNYLYWISGEMSHNDLLVVVMPELSPIVLMLLPEHVYCVVQPRDQPVLEFLKILKFKV